MGGQGGGAGALGTATYQSCSYTVVGRAGAGLQWFDGNYYAGGGACGITGSTSSSGATRGQSGLGNTGYGGYSYAFPRLDAGAAAVNKGGGGNGGSDGADYTAGGSGVVIIRYAGAQVGTGGTVTVAGGFTYHTFTSSGTFVSSS